jgi:mycothiol synthase
MSGGSTSAPSSVRGMSDVGTFTVRACTPDDIPRVLALAAADEERVMGRASRIVEGDIRDWWETVDLAAESWLLLRPDDDTVAGVVWLDKQGDELAVAFPIAADQEVVTDLVDLVERRAAETGLQRLHVAVLSPDPEPERVLPEKGFHEVRRFYEMGIELEASPPAVVLPDGFTLQAATVEDARAFHETLEEAFEDHWEHHAQPFEQWWKQRSSDPEFDISWWFTVREGERMVAAIRNIPARNGGVYVASLGVRRDRRGRGLAKALLIHTFRRSFEAGFPRITLGVDATNPTGATALYRSVGMTSELETAVWEKSLTT